jgi:hypothetical protein
MVLILLRQTALAFTRSISLLYTACHRSWSCS